jgi:hypothetical protein
LLTPYPPEVVEREEVAMKVTFCISRLDATSV